MKALKNFWSIIYPKPRPYWFVDAKWISGILFVLCFTATLWLFNFTQVISRDNIVDNITTEFQTYLVQKVQNWNIQIQGAGDLKNQITAVKNQIHDLAVTAQNNQNQEAANPLGVIKPIPGLNISIQKNQLQKYANQAQTTIYNEIENLLNQSKIEDLVGKAESIQNVLPQGFNLKDTVVAGIKDQIIKNINFSKVYSESRYNKYRHLADVLLVISIFLLLLAIFFSYRFGRLFTPGLLIFISSVPGVYIFNTIYKYLKETPLNKLAQSNNEVIRTLASIILKAKDRQINALYNVHKGVLIIAALLILTSLAGKIIYELRLHQAPVRKTIARKKPVRKNK